MGSRVANIRTNSLLDGRKMLLWASSRHVKWVPQKTAAVLRSASNGRQVKQRGRNIQLWADALLLLSFKTSRSTAQRSPPFHHTWSPTEGRAGFYSGIHPNMSEICSSAGRSCDVSDETDGESVFQLVVQTSDSWFHTSLFPYELLEARGVYGRTQSQRTNAQSALRLQSS